MKTRTTVIASTATLLLSTLLMSGNASAAQQCANLVFKSQGTQAHGAFYRAKKRRAERRAKRQWKYDVARTPTLGSRYADLDNAKNVVINCHLKNSDLSMSCTVVAQPCADD